MDRQTLLALMQEDVIPLRVKFDDYLSVALGARRASQIVVPGELPDAAVLGATIDDRFRQKMQGRRLPGESVSEYFKGKVGKYWRRSQMQEIRFRTGVLRDIYSDVVEKSHSYNVFMKWADRLGFLKKELESRPTIREIYFFKDPAIGAELDELQEMRKDIRYERLRHPDPSIPAYASAFPEEVNQAYLKKLGGILGFPACCIDRYVFDRQSGVLSPESRASNQIVHSESPDEIVDLAYFAKDFFPCQPDCPNAVAKGRTMYEELLKLDEGIAAKYRQHLLENADLVRRYPEIIQKKIESLESLRAKRQEVDNLEYEERT